MVSLTILFLKRRRSWHALIDMFYIHSLVLQIIIGKEKKQNEKKKQNNNTVLC